MNILIVYNPVAGTKSVFDVEKILKTELEAGKFAYKWYETKKDAPNGFGDVLLHGNFDRVIAVGGDGTVNEVASFLLEHDVDASLGIIPQGSGNLLAQALGIPFFDIKKAVRLALQGDSKQIDVMRVNDDRYGFVAVGQGFDTHLIKETNRSMKRRMGVFAYIWTFVKSFFFYQSHEYELTVDGTKHLVQGKSVMIINLLAFAGIPFQPSMKPDDGVLSIAVLNPKSYSFFPMVGFCLRALCRLPHKSTPEFQFFSGKSIVLKQKKGKEAQVDGEWFCSDGLVVEVLPGACSVICPPF